MVFVVMSGVSSSTGLLILGLHWSHVRWRVDFSDARFKPFYMDISRNAPVDGNNDFINQQQQ
jgi:hypothetical protein